MADLVELAIPANAQAAAEALGLKVHRVGRGFAKYHARRPRSRSNVCAIGVSLRAFWRTPWAVRGHEQEKGPRLVCLPAVG